MVGAGGGGGGGVLVGGGGVSVGGSATGVGVSVAGTGAGVGGGDISAALRSLNFTTAGCWLVGSSVVTAATLPGVRVNVGHGVRVGMAVGSAEPPASRSVRPHPILTTASVKTSPNTTLICLFFITIAE